MSNTRLEWIYTYQETPCSKQAPYLKLKWLQQNTNPKPFSLETNTQPFSKIGQMIELCCEYVSVMVRLLQFSSRHISVLSEYALRNCLNVKELFAQNRPDIWN